MKLPAGQGLFPAFWASKTFFVENLPEIDIVEFLGQQTDTVYHGYRTMDPNNGWATTSTPELATFNEDFTQDWHTFGMEWGPTEIIWYVDGNEVHRVDSSEYLIANQAVYLLANLTVGGDQAGTPDADTLASNFQLMFEDNFDGTSIDTSKWKSNLLWGPYFPINEEKQIYPDMLGVHQDYEHNPFSVADGYLTITAKAVDENELPAAQTPDSEQFVDNPSWVKNQGYRDPDPQAESDGYRPFTPNYVSGLLTSYDSFKFVSGYAEFGAKLPKGSGLWPAFWLLNGYYVDQQPEIDIMEFRGENPNEIIHSYHFTNDEGIQENESTTTVGVDFTEEYHAYGVHWQPGKIDWYIDGELVHTITGERVSSQVMYIILNLAVGGNFVGEVDEGALPADYSIDYVRVWQQKLPAPLVEQNQAPVAMGDTIGPLDAGASITFPVTANDSDADGEVITTSVTIVSQPASGTAEVLADGQITYTHDGSSGADSDSFTYTVLDDSGAVSNEATVTITPIEQATEPGLDVAMIDPALRDWSGDKKHF